MRNGHLGHHAHEQRRAFVREAFQGFRPLPLPGVQQVAEERFREFVARSERSTRPFRRLAFLPRRPQIRQARRIPVLFYRLRWGLRAQATAPARSAASTLSRCRQDGSRRTFTHSSVRTNVLCALYTALGLRLTTHFLNFRQLPEMHRPPLPRRNDHRPLFAQFGERHHFPTRKMHCRFARPQRVGVQPPIDRDHLFLDPRQAALAGSIRHAADSLPTPSRRPS